MIRDTDITTYDQRVLNNDIRLNEGISHMSSVSHNLKTLRDPTGLDHHIKSES
jgi:hypothetical protein